MFGYFSSTIADDDDDDLDDEMMALLQAGESELEARRAAAADELARADAARQAEFQARAERLERERVQGMLLVVFVSFCCSF